MPAIRDIYTWKKEWQDVIEVIEKMNPRISDFEADKKAMEALHAKDELYTKASITALSLTDITALITNSFNHWKDTYLREYNRTG